MLSLRPMNDAEFQQLVARVVPDYAADKVAVGDWPAADAEQRAEMEFGRLLDQGLATPGHHLYTIDHAGDGPVGAIWLAMRPGTTVAFVYDLFIAPTWRRRGFGRAAMQLLETTARQLGASTLALHVFGHNDAAVALYQHLGYRVTDIHMAKPLTEATFPDPSTRSAP
ncbi:GNAT family N-acetyltransferase [Chitinimonas lacunae]|uniref:GNAT family N-acetyltransferase n=1 Tax=Chitinimonas lacunae TaxID=1963018 RepID=A0ABV8MWY5_9NEIS